MWEGDFKAQVLFDGAFVSSSSQHWKVASERQKNNTTMPEAKRSTRGNVSGPLRFRFK
jgi:hypothetical protein